MRSCLFITESRRQMLAYRIVPVLAFLLLSACSTQTLRSPDLASPYLHSQGRLAKCAELFNQIDKSTLQVSATDAQAARLSGFPYLRVNRLLASFRHELQEPHKLLAWLTALRQLDQQARHYELQNTPVEDMEYSEEDDISSRLDTCATDMLQADRQDPLKVKQIEQAAVVPDSYINGNRILGVYPLSRLFVRNGVRQLQGEVKATFSKTTKNLLIQGTLVGYTPDETVAVGEADVARIMRFSRTNALSVPSFSKQDEDSLFRYFAPVWELDEVSGEDRIGAPYWSADKKIMIETGENVVYRYLSYTRLNDLVLPQFNYIIWFPSRPATGAFDILAGHLDGITWRVTVGRDGKPLMYDAMHNCGCYHMFFPTGDMITRDTVPGDREEPILVPQQAPQLQAGQRLHLRIAAGSHYIEALQAKSIARGSTTYRFADYNELRSIAMKNGQRKSMFDVNGMVPGSHRKERWLLWPMGVEDAGAMRQWGHHAIAFIGRRHFDDADLLEHYFVFPDGIVLAPVRSSKVLRSSTSSSISAILVIVNQGETPPDWHASLRFEEAIAAVFPPAVDRLKTLLSNEKKGNGFIFPSEKRGEYNLPSTAF